jgi:hypothetical protein
LRADIAWWAIDTCPALVPLFTLIARLAAEADLPGMSLGPLRPLLAGIAPFSDRARRANISLSDMPPLLVRVGNNKECMHSHTQVRTRARTYARTHARTESHLFQ